jgi:hypothetical protein
MNLPTHFNELSSTKFLLQLFPHASSSGTHTNPPPYIRSSAKSRVETVLSSLAIIKPLLLTSREAHSSTFEFRNIENLGRSLRNVDELGSIEEVFFQLSLLKSWMFCMELSASGSGDVYGELGAKVVRLHFYGFLEAMIPYFPPGCRGRLEDVCAVEIRELSDEVCLESGKEVREAVGMFWGNSGFPEQRDSLWSN